MEMEKNGGMGIYGRAEKRATPSVVENNQGNTNKKVFAVPDASTTSCQLFS